MKMYNACIGRLADHWVKHGVVLIKESANFFYSKDGIPTARYFAPDGIHLSNSDIKRLLHAIDSRIPLIDDFNQCIYKPRRIRKPVGSAPGRFHCPSGPTTAGRGLLSGGYNGNGTNNNNNNRYAKRQCYACGMTNHVIRDCWNK